MAADYLVQEDGSSRFTLEDSSGFILFDGNPPPPPSVELLGTKLLRLGRRAGPPILAVQNEDNLNLYPLTSASPLWASVEWAKARPLQWQIGPPLLANQQREVDLRSPPPTGSIDPSQTWWVNAADDPLHPTLGAPHVGPPILVYQVWDDSRPLVPGTAGYQDQNDPARPFPWRAGPPLLVSQITGDDFGLPQVGIMPDTFESYVPVPPVLVGQGRNIQGPPLLAQQGFQQFGGQEVHRVTQFVVEEIVLPDGMGGRVTQLVLEEIVLPSPAGRVTHIVVEEIVQPSNANVRVTQLVVETITAIVPTSLFATQLVVETIIPVPREIVRVWVID